MSDAPPCDAGAILLAGGESRRMGQNKCLMSVQGRPLIEHVCEQLRPHFPEILLSTNTPELYAFLGVPMIPDELPGQGPLMGLASALARARFDWNLVVAADIPEIPETLIAQLLAHTAGARAVVPRTAAGHLEPLFALYHRALLPDIHRHLKNGNRQVHRLMDLPGARELPITSGLLQNLNTPQDYAAWYRPGTPGQGQES